MKANYTSLVLKSLENNLSESEKITFANWLHVEDNFKKYQKIKQIWNESGKLTYPELEASLNVEEAYQKVKRKAGLSDATTRYITPKKRRTPYLVAASFILLAMTCSYFLLQFITSNDFKTLTAVQNMEYTLPDLSTVWLSEGTELSYHPDFKNHRNIKLDGKALFEVIHDTEKPFTVDADGMDVTVLGTKFIVSNEETSTAYIHVINGKVKVEDPNNNVQPHILTQDMTVEKIESKLKITDKIYANQMFWATNKLYYKDASLERIFDDLENYFHTTITYSDTFKDCNFSGSFSEQNIQEILSTLEIIYNLEIEKKPGNISITGPSCD